MTKWTSRTGHESFRYRSAVVDQYGSSASSALGGAGASGFSSLCSEDDIRATGGSDPFPFASRASALQRLHDASSGPVVTNDLRLKNEKEEKQRNTILEEEAEAEAEAEDEAACSVGCVTFALEDDVEEISCRQTPPPPPRVQTPVTAHRRNAGPYTIIAFVNSKSGGGNGNALYKSLQSHLGPSFVIDLNSCRPGSMPEDSLAKYAHDPMVRVLACGGDGTCGWIFSSMDKVWATILDQKDKSSTRGRVHSSKYKDHLPLAIMPLGTGNDLSRQFGWGGAFAPHMKEKNMIATVQRSKLTGLDRWRCIIMPVQTVGEEEKQFIPKILGESLHDTVIPGGAEEEETAYSRQNTVEVLHSLLDDDDAPTQSKRRKSQKKLTKNISNPSTQIFDGVFCNYFSLGFDATIAYLFHHEREVHPEKFTSPTKNKMIYIQKSPYALKAPKLRKKLKVMVNNEKGQLVNLKIPKSCRAIILMNIQSYGGGNHLTKKGSSSDGLIEVIFVSNLFRLASTAMSAVAPFLHLRVAAQTNNVCIRTMCPLHCEIDGEPWLQGDGVIQVKFHSRNSILQKVKDDRSCGCMGGTADAVINTESA